jgi:hypothetical protein
MRRSICVLSCALAALVTATGCHGHDPAVRPAARSRATAAVPTPKAPAGVMVGVIRKSGALAVYRIGRDRRARPVAGFAAPQPGERASSVSFTSGPRPRACATWVHYDDIGRATAPAALVCYQPDSSPKATTLAGLIDSPTSVALSADGREVAWIDYQESNNEADVVFGALSGDRVTAVRRVLPGHGMQCNPCLEEVTSVAWAGDHALILSREGQDDEGAGLGRLPLDDRHISRGWLDGASTMPAWTADQPYDFFDDVVSADWHSALAVERPSDNPPPRGVRARAVTVDLATGRRVGIIATALPGRDVTAVSGGAEGVVYRTGSGYDADPRFYLRLPGDAVGQPIIALPSDTMDVVAQPS